MPIPSLLIVTDRGGLRAYKVEPNPNRAPGLHLLDSFEAAETHGRYEDKVTDQAGRFQGGRHATGGIIGGADEHGTIDLENQCRGCKHVAARINELVRREKPETWLLAVPPEIQKIVIEHLDDEAVKHLSQTVHANLLKIDPSKLAGHFSGLHQA